MIDSTNPRIMADNIRKLSEASGSGGSTVVPNPEGEATGNLSSLGIDGNKYTIPEYSPVDYSTDEVDTGIKWVDGSSIYRKTISFGEVSAAALKSVNHGVDNLGDVIRIYGSAYSGIRFIPIPFVDNVDTYQRSVEITATQITIGQGSNSPALTRAYVTMEYTKVAAPSRSKSKK